MRRVRCIILSLAVAAVLAGGLACEKTIHDVRTDAPPAGAAAQR